MADSFSSVRFVALAAVVMLFSCGNWAWIYNIDSDPGNSGMCYKCLDIVDQSTNQMVNECFFLRVSAGGTEFVRYLRNCQRARCYNYAKALPSSPNPLVIQLSDSYNEEFCPDRIKNCQVYLKKFSSWRKIESYKCDPENNPYIYK